MSVIFHQVYFLKYRGLLNILSFIKKNYKTARKRCQDKHTLIISGVMVFGPLEKNIAISGAVLVDMSVDV